MIKVISGPNTYECTSKEHAVNSIISDYHLYDVCIGEVLGSVEIQGASVQDVVDIFAKVMYIVEEDEVIQFMNMDKAEPDAVVRFDW
jgi:hypothetical protein